EQRADMLRRLGRDLAAQRARRRQDALRCVAELMIDAAALRISSDPDEAARAAAAQTLRERARNREQQCVHALLKLYQFKRSTFPDHALPLEGERWGMDLFHPMALKAFGIQVGKGLATGAVAGATIDAMTGGLSLGAAALLGAAGGGRWQGIGEWGGRLMGRLTGKREITFNAPVLKLLALRQLPLVRALERRGHAALSPIEPGTPDATVPEELLELLHEARSQPQ